MFLLVTVIMLLFFFLLQLFLLGVVVHLLGDLLLVAALDFLDACSSCHLWSRSD
jgi:hypothetical protein